ncbi:MAG: DMT family transporter [Bacteroidetes bacterium]|nr:DMT family transporter [Bacteroidota bacterium]
MGWTLLSILLSGSLIILFRVFRQYRVSILQTIVVNYWVCTLLGLALLPDYFSLAAAMPPEAWGTGILQGAMFISLFFLIGYASQTIGVAYTAMLTKLSVIIPTLLSWLVFGDAMPWERWLGMALAILAVWLMHLPYLGGHSHARGARQVLLLSVILLAGTGLADSNLKVFDHYHGASVPGEVFSITLFGAAALLGTGAVLVQWARGVIRPSARNLVSGALLGIPNYFSIVTLLLALRQMDGTVFFPLNNVGQLLLVSLAGVVLFREAFTLRSWLGLCLAVGALLLISWRQLIVS